MGESVRSDLCDAPRHRPPGTYVSVRHALVPCQDLIFGFERLRRMVAEGRKPSGSTALSDKPDGLRRSAITPKLSLDKALLLRLRLDASDHSADAMGKRAVGSGLELRQEQRTA
jgi:hypothetical protein